MITVTFSFQCSYLNRVWFNVYGDGEPYQVVYRHSVSDYEAKTYSGTLGSYEAIEGPKVGLLMRENCYKHQPLSREVVLAYNAWRAQLACEANARFVANPHRYGVQPAEVLPDLIAKGSVHYDEGYQFYPLMEVA